MLDISKNKEYITLFIAIGAFALSIFNFVSQRADKNNDYKFKMAELINGQYKKEQDIVRKIGYDSINKVNIINKCNEKIWVTVTYVSITDDIITKGRTVLMPNDTLYDHILTFKTRFYYHIDSDSYNWHKQSYFRFSVGESPFVFIENYPQLGKVTEENFIEIDFSKKIDSNKIFTLEIGRKSN